MKRISTLIIAISVFTLTKAQPKTQADSFVIGKPCPAIILNNIKFYTKKAVKVSDFKGQWLILDFWSKYCSSCIASFPATNRLQKQFAGKVQFMLVGYEDREQQMKPLFTRLSSRLGLNLPCSFDSLLCQRFNIYSFPQIIAVDPQGIVRAWVSEIDSNAIVDLLSGKGVELSKPKRVPFDYDQPLLVNGNGGPDTAFQYRSMLAVYQHNLAIVDPSNLVGQFAKTGRVQMSGYPLTYLYNFAFFGTGEPSVRPGAANYGDYYNFPILEVNDSSLFKYSSKTNANLFAYSLIMPPAKSSREKLMSVMQKDLENYFDFEAKVETRDLPYWALITISPDAKEKLKPKGTHTYWEGSTYDKFTLHSIAIENFMANFPSNWGSRVFLNETGVTGKIDISMDCLMSDFDDVKRELRKHGLDLVPKTKPMKVVVIRDAKVN